MMPVPVARGHARRSTGHPLAVFLAAAALLQPGAGAAQVLQQPVGVRIAAGVVPPGAMLQIRLLLEEPHQIAGGSVMMDLDPGLFGPIAAVDVFSATGDQVGAATIQDRHLYAQFASPSGGIGRLPGLPVMTITVPVLAWAHNDATSSITFTSGGAAWKDVRGNQYQPVAQPGEVRVGGTLSIGSVTPGGGLLPAGTRVRIGGSGFTPATAVQIDGVVLASTLFSGPQAMDAELGAPADLTGKRVVVRNPDGTQADFFSALRGIPESPAGNQQPIFPQQTYLAAELGTTAYGYALENQNLEPVDV